MRLTSVNVGLPRQVMHEGRSVQTGIFKQPVDGPVYVGRNHMDGDGQADPVHHGGPDKAVYAFALEQYDYWQTALQRPPMSYGQFGENLTIAGLDESTACVGDCLRIGDVRLVITQPRIPCFKLGLRMQQPDMPARFTAHAWTGCYLRVDHEGTITAGDRVEYVSRAHDSVSIRELFQAFTNPNQSGAATVLRRALDVPELAARLRTQIRRRLGDRQA
jgi:MOSC domain-containing protein YiiM